MTADDEILFRQPLERLVGAPLTYGFAGIYQIELIGTNRSYVGRSHCVGNRLYTHANGLMLNQHPKHKLQSAWNEHGSDAVRFKLLERIDGAEELVKAEQRWIDYYQAASVGFDIAPMAGPNRIADASDRLAFMSFPKGHRPKIVFHQSAPAPQW